MRQEPFTEGKQGTNQALQESMRQNRKGDKVIGELKSFRIKEVEDGCPFWQAEYEVYSKYEVDKVIARSKEKLVEQTTLRVWAELQLRNNKYKRCLAMAKWCNERWILDDCLYELGKTRFYERWEKRWLELAEQFKEAK